MISRCLREGRGSTPREVARAYRLTARISGSHPDGRGSNPRTLTSQTRSCPAAWTLAPGARVRGFPLLVCDAHQQHVAVATPPPRPSPVRPMARRFSYKEETGVRFTHLGPDVAVVQRQDARFVNARCGFDSRLRLQFACSSMQSSRFLPGEMWVQLPLGEPTTAASLGSSRVS
jgi:hypothetical protein